MKVSTQLSLAIESLHGEDGTLYSLDGGYIWWVQYKGGGPLVLARSPTPLTTTQAERVFEDAKNTILHKFADEGQKMLNKVRPGDEWKNS